MTDIMSAHILVVDDDPQIRSLLNEYLTQNGMRVSSASTGREMMQILEDETIDLVILDLRLKDEDGMSLARGLRERLAISVIMLTGVREEADRVMGLELGADDYVTKPFSPRELVLRVKSQIRRSQGSDEPADTLRAGDLVLDRLRHSVTVKGKPILLTATEFKLLSLLMERSGRVQTREILLNEVWGYDVAIQSRTVDIHVRRLREKLGRASDCIETVRGFGYRIAEVV